MPDRLLQPANETFAAIRKYRAKLLVALRPYLAAVLIVTVLLSIWAELVAA
jgi:hypothetical protein